MYLLRRAYDALSLVIPLLHSLHPLLVLAGRHLCTLLDRYNNHLSSSIVPVNNHFIYNGMTAA